MTAAAATNATVADVLEQLDGSFAPMASAFGNAVFALWVGSGISFKLAPDLGEIVSRALEFLRAKAVHPDTYNIFNNVFRRALAISQTPIAAAEPHFNTPFFEWPGEVREPIVDGLWSRYSQLLNIPVQGEAEDYILWEAVDVRAAFDNPPPPGCVHLCIAILVLEGAIREIASANWDGFIEAAVTELAGGLPGNLQVVVDPVHLRDDPGKARLIKFHGCIVHATQDEAHYRKFLVGSTGQINAWPHGQRYAAIRNEVVSLATNHRALMTGLSLQDGNLQAVFNLARAANPWPWPCEPQAHVFCEGEIGDHQRIMLQSVYAGSYNNAIAEIESSALIMAWGEQVLLALVLKVLSDKLSALVVATLNEGSLAADTANVVASLTRLRDAVAGEANGDRTAFANEAIAMWSRMLGIFRFGKLPQGPGRYQALSHGTVSGIAQDQNALAAGFGELGVGLALLQRGVDDRLWTITRPANDGLSAGAMSVLATWEGAVPRPVFIAKSAQAVIALEKSGAFANDNAIVIHADDAWHVLNGDGADEGPRSISRSPGRNGMIRTQHLSVARMLAAETTMDGLATRFVREASI